MFNNGVCAIISSIMPDFDENQAEERCITVFRAAIKSKETERMYVRNVSKFKEFLKVRTFSEILELPDLQQRLEDYVMFLKKTQHPNSVNTLYAPIQAFLEMNDKILNFKKVRRFFPARVKTAVERGWTTEEIRRMLSVATNLRTKAIIHFENATGGRLGIFEGLKIKHLIPIEDCYAVIGYAGEKEQYTTFLTPEARRSLDRYIDLRRQDGEAITPESPVFRTAYRIGSEKVKPASKQTLGEAVKLAQENCGLRDPRIKKGRRFPIPTNHGFRHRFDEIIKSVQGVNAHLAEKMFAHASRLIPLDGTYLNPNTDRLFQEYKKIIPYLTIDDREQTEAEKKALAIERSELEKQKVRLDKTERELAVLKREVERLLGTKPKTV